MNTPKINRTLLSRKDAKTAKKSFDTDNGGFLYEDA
jgi:hypothetical protein